MLEKTYNTIFFYLSKVELCSQTWSKLLDCVAHVASNYQLLLKINDAGCS